MIALVEARKAGLFNISNWLNNITAGLTVGVVALPLAMAFAIASGVKPEQGVYTAIIAGLVVSIFGGSRVQIAGPTGAFVIILSGITAEHGLIGLQIATLMAGCILIVFGLTKMGGVIKFIPDPVIVGFTSGIAVLIWVGQWKHFFGLNGVDAEHFHSQVVSLIKALPEFHLETTALSLLALVLVFLGPRIWGLKKLPGPLFALLAATTIQNTFEFEGVKTIGSAFGGIPQGLPDFNWPSIGSVDVLALVGPAFTIAMLGSIESLLSAVVADGMAGTRHQSNQELIGQGMANILTPLFGGFAATGAIARTATNIRNGGNSPLSGITHSITLMVILLSLAPLAAHIPLSALSAILFFVAWNMSEAKHFIKLIRKAPAADVTILLVTFCLTIFTDLVIAVNIGLILAILHFLRRMASSVDVRLFTEEELTNEFAHKGLANLPDDLIVFSVEGPFFFGAVENFERVLGKNNADPEHIIIRLKWVPFIDYTGIQSLEEAIQGFQQRGVQVMLSGANHLVRKKLQKAGVIDLIGEQNIYADFECALKSVKDHSLSINKEITP